MPESDKYVYVLSAFRGSDFVDIHIASSVEKALAFAPKFAKGSSWEDYAIYKVLVDGDPGCADKHIMDLDKNGEPVESSHAQAK